MPDESLLFGFTRKPNVLHPRVVVTRWDGEALHWIDTIPNCIYGNWNVCPDGTFWIGSRNERAGCFETGTSFKHYDLNGTVLAEWIGPYAVQGFAGKENDWAIFSRQCYSSHLNVTMIPAIRVFSANDRRFIEREWPNGWGCTSAIVTPDNELWCFGSEYRSDGSPSWDVTEILLENGRRVPAPSSGYKFSETTKAAFSTDGWLYLSGDDKNYLYAAKMRDIKAGTPNWRGLLDLSKNSEYRIDQASCLVAGADGIVVVGNEDGYLELKGGTIVRGDDIIEQSRPSPGIMLPQHFAFFRDYIVQGVVKYGDVKQGGLRFIPRASLGEEDVTWDELGPIPEELLSRRPRRVQKSLQHHLVFEEKNVAPN